MLLCCVSTFATLPAAPLPDISSVAADLSVSELVDGPPGAGKRVRLELFEGTPPVILYLPTDWVPGKKFPVIIELAGKFPLAGTRLHLENSGVSGDFTFLETGFRNHNDAWALRPSAARDTAREWLAEVIKKPADR